MRSLLTIGAIGLLAGCQAPQHTASAPARPAPIATAIVMHVDAPSTRPTLAGTVMLLGDIKNPGQRELRLGEKITDILKNAELSTPATKLTLVLNRRCPEGMTSEMIDLDQNLKLVDAVRNVDLRDGDELIVSVAPSIPTGLSRPTAAALPTQ